MKKLTYIENKYHFLIKIHIFMSMYTINNTLHIFVNKVLRTLNDIQAAQSNKSYKSLLPFSFGPEFVSQPWILFRTFETCVQIPI